MINNRLSNPIIVYYTTKSVLLPSAHPTGFFRSPSRQVAKRLASCWDCRRLWNL